MWENHLKLCFASEDRGHHLHSLPYSRVCKNTVTYVYRNPFWIGKYYVDPWQLESFLLSDYQFQARKKSGDILHIGIYYMSGEWSPLLGAIKISAKTPDPKPESDIR